MGTMEKQIDAVVVHINFVYRVEDRRRRKEAISRVYLVAYLHNCHERIIKQVNFFFLFFLDLFFQCQIYLRQMMMEKDIYKEKPAAITQGPTENNPPVC